MKPSELIKLADRFEVAKDPTEIWEWVIRVERRDQDNGSVLWLVTNNNSWEWCRKAQQFVYPRSHGWRKTRRFKTLRRAWKYAKLAEQYMLGRNAEYMAKWKESEKVME